MSAGEAGLDGWSIDVTQSADMIHLVFPPVYSQVSN